MIIRTEMSSPRTERGPVPQPFSLKLDLISQHIRNLSQISVLTNAVIFSIDGYKHDDLQVVSKERRLLQLFVSALK